MAKGMRLELDVGDWVKNWSGKCNSVLISWAVETGLVSFTTGRHIGQVQEATTTECRRFLGHDLHLPQIISFFSGSLVVQDCEIQAAWIKIKSYYFT